MSSKGLLAGNGFVQGTVLAPFVFFCKKKCDKKFKIASAYYLCLHKGLIIVCLVFYLGHIVKFSARLSGLGVRESLMFRSVYPIAV